MKVIHAYCSKRRDLGLGNSRLGNAVRMLTHVLCKPVPYNSFDYFLINREILLLNKGIFSTFVCLKHALNCLPFSRLVFVIFFIVKTVHIFGLRIQFGFQKAVFLVNLDHAYPVNMI